MHKFLQKAMDYCQVHEYDESIDYHLCSIIVRGGKILSIGYNSHDINGFVEFYTKIGKENDRDYCSTTHAEQNAVLKARGKIDLQGCDIYVVRRKWKDATYGIARPCRICRRVLHAYGIRRAFYSVDDNTYNVMKVISPKEDDSGTTTDRIILSNEKHL